MAPAVFSLYIINRYGSLIYNQDFSNSRLTNNDHLMLASIFHGLHTISTQLSPTGSSGGIENLVTDSFKLECYETPTGVKFYGVADKSLQNLGQMLRAAYEIYSDFVLKNPFYDMDQPIRFEMFDSQIQNLFNPRVKG